MFFYYNPESFAEAECAYLLVVFEAKLFSSMFLKLNWHNSHDVLINNVSICNKNIVHTKFRRNTKSVNFVDVNGSEDYLGIEEVDDTEVILFLTFENT